MNKKQLNFGLIGSGFMGKTHIFGISLANRVFDLAFNLKVKKIADVSSVLAAKAASELGVKESTGDWRELVNDSNIHVINITSPNFLHKEMALAAIKAGKHVYCEKPLSISESDAKEMSSAASASEIKTQVGFNYICNPMLRKAREMILRGDLGEIRGFRGIHAEDYMAPSESPYTWRHDKVGGGALADLGSHIIATAEFLIGPISYVLGDCTTSIKNRADILGKIQNVETDDVTRAFLRFENGASGSIEANWIAMGRKMQHDFEVFGSKGALFFSQERLNELLFYKNDDPDGEKGFKTICASPDHEPYGRFCVAPGHQLGFGDLKAIEVKGFVDAISGLSLEPFNFEAGLRIQTLVELIQKSSKQTKWLAVT
jgi:predicted dehydrogenase